ncbi:MAG: aldo/keto reductase [Euryarchaeota archaeon]|nr:aldo/keto reductase [Euryarchaeota archaeon]MBU4608646.1 aldo/keto reductase [Euryarchaeota archaeon]MBV1729136.1 aldo/keto reductase [Methanobacterium sp.]MBV1754956.1 aldo/keto reductase [Methanobacterium sp.]
MLYRKLGSTGINVSILGFGVMRLPLDGNGAIDQDKSSSMLKFAIENGLNYIDTAFPYHDGQSEIFLGNFFERYPELKKKVYISTKLPTWLINRPEDMDYYLKRQMENLKVDKIDFYLLHSLNKDYWKNLMKFNVLDFLDSAVAEGKINYTGFSFHDEFDIFLEILDSYSWDVCQIQFNFMDENYQAGREGLRYAASQGLGTIIMEPLRGGCLTRNIPEDIMEIWEMADEPKKPVEWALQYVWDYPETNVVLSGMSSFSQVQENMKLASKAQASSLTKNDYEIIKEVRRSYREKIVIDCTSCGYCMPCPEGVDIPKNFNIYNTYKMFDDDNGIKTHYHGLLKENQRASQCKEMEACGKCNNICPQMIPIPQTLQKVKKAFEKR